MKILKNENLLDRFLRALLGELLLLIGFFWLSAASQILFYILGIIFVFTAFTGFCLLYKVFNVDTLNKNNTNLNKKIVYLFFLILIIFPIIGGYYSNFFSKKIFLEDYNRMNNYYKQTLFNTGQDKRAESIENYEKLVIEYDRFENKYSVYHPYVIKGDAEFNNNIKEVKREIALAGDMVYDGNLPVLHKDLEKIRPIFQDILKRNGFSMLAVSLVDFHDAMEKIISAADEKNGQGVIEVYNEVDNKLKAVEEIAHDDEIKAIRANLNALFELAKNNQIESMSKKAAELKSSFVKVYLKRG